MAGKVKAVILTAVLGATMLLPAAPASASCAADDPVIDLVVCRTVYPAGQSVTCKVARKIDPEAGCMT